MLARDDVGGRVVRASAGGMLLRVMPSLRASASRLARSLSLLRTAGFATVIDGPCPGGVGVTIGFGGMDATGSSATPWMGIAGAVALRRSSSIDCVCLCAER